MVRWPSTGAFVAIHDAIRQEVEMAKRAERRFYWRWPNDGMSWFAWAFQNYGSKWIVWRVGPLNYRVQIAEPGECGGYIHHTR